MSRHSTDRFWETFPLRELFDEVCQPLQSRLARQTVQTIVDIPSSQCVTADRELLRQAVRNLVLNALDAMPEGGSLVAISAAGPDVLELEIADTGSSLSEQERREAFETLPISRRGDAWELVVAHRIAELHGGGVTAVNCPDGGAAFTLRIPRAGALEIPRAGALEVAV